MTERFVQWRWLNSVAIFNCGCWQNTIRTIIVAHCQLFVRSSVNKSSSRRTWRVKADTHYPYVRPVEDTRTMPEAFCSRCYVIDVVISLENTWVVHAKRNCCCSQPLFVCYLKQNDVKDVNVGLQTILVDSSTILAILYVKCSVRMKPSSEVYLAWISQA